MSVAPPVSVDPPRPEDMEAITRWLCQPEIYEEAFMLARPDPAWIQASMLVVKHDQRDEFQAVRLWSVRDRQDALIGLGVDYGWSQANDTERELDFALPGSGQVNPMVPIYTLATIMDRLFAEHQATAVWGRVRLGPSGKGFPHLFEAIGGSPQKVEWDLQPSSGKRAPRVYYKATPEAFYASTFGKRWGRT